MTRWAFGNYPHQQRVFITVDLHRNNRLRVTASFTFMPVLLPTTRPKPRLLGFKTPPVTFCVHVRHHQYAIGIIVHHDGGNQAVRSAFKIRF